MYFNEDFDDRFYFKNEKTDQNPYGRYHHGHTPQDDRKKPNTPPGRFPERNPYGQRPDGFFPGQGDVDLPPPPKGSPARQPSVYAVDPRSIQNCVRNYTYIWLSDGKEFWMYPTYVGRTSISGYRWNGRYGWVYFGIDLAMIESFYCLPY